MFCIRDTYRGLLNMHKHKLNRIYRPTLYAYQARHVVQ